VAPLGSPDGPSGRLCDIALNEIHPNPSQPRKRFDDASLTALADSIREHGVLQPVIVQPRTAGGYELIAGERRWRASKIAGIATIPTLIAQPVDTGQSVELALSENVAREDLRAGSISLSSEAVRGPGQQAGACRGQKRSSVTPPIRSDRRGPAQRTRCRPAR
jgi:ParB-like nuclease domain